ncbi:MAG: glycosyltransferase [Lacunisphaera sp.]
MWTRPAPFTVVLCTFNGAKYLDEQLQSLREQDGVAEIVASDDGSTDDTLAILHRHAAEDARVRINRNSGRLGVTRNFEQAIQLARSPWIALADQDDVWLPGKLARIRARWDGGAGLVHHASRKFSGFHVPRQFAHWIGAGRKFSGSDWRRLLYRNTVVGHTTLFRADLAARLAPFPPEIPHDWWLGAGAALHGRVQFVNECLVHYRIHSTNAYHAAGSRVRRLQAEHTQRVALLQTLLRRHLLPPREAEFAEQYLALLRGSSPGVFPWRLWHFYRWHAALFFGGPDYEPSFVTSQRKSWGAAVAAMLQAPVAAGEPAGLAVSEGSVPLND